MLLMRKSFASPQRGLVLLLAAVCFAAGLSAGMLVGPVGASRAMAVAPPLRVEPTAAVQIGALRAGHPAEVVRVLDGDTFKARVRI